jgi:hypothetical protein
MSVLDEMVAWRVRIAISRATKEKKVFIPVQLDRELPPGESLAIVQPSPFDFRIRHSVGKRAQYKHERTLWLANCYSSQNS